MFIRSKPFSEQVVVVTGASSGIGIATASAARPIGRGMSITAILDAAGRDHSIGNGGKPMRWLNKRVPAAVDWMASRLGPLQSSGPPSRRCEGSIHAVAMDRQVHGHPASAVRGSTDTRAQTHPRTMIALAAPDSVAAVALATTAKQS